MTPQLARLATSGGHYLAGRLIDRNRSLTFQLDGRLIAGFAGDTVLSATLACGLAGSGAFEDFPLALGGGSAPAICRSGQPSAPLPMNRTPAQHGASYTTIGPHRHNGMLRRIFGWGRKSLDLDLDRPEALRLPWLAQAAEHGPPADLVVVGGGIAGMTAALAGARKGLRVILVESTGLLGGDARLFGTRDGEETPDQAIVRLTAAVEAADAITVMTSTRAIALQPGMVRLHKVMLQDDLPVGRVVDIASASIILATGTQDRLPVFPGNRLTGVTGLQEAFALADRYGVWPGRSAIFATSSNAAYRLAMLASDAGIAVRRVIDSRPRPQSRFIEFSRAYGLTQAAGTIVASATPGADGGLAIAPQLDLDGYVRAEPALSADRLLVCGGWQPDLSLWHMAGGQSVWNERHHRLEATGSLAGVALAGSAAGWFSLSAAMASGAAALAGLLGGEQPPVEDSLIDPLYETPDGPLPVGALPDGASPPAFLDAGRERLARPRVVPRNWTSRLGLGRRGPAWSLTDAPGALDAAAIGAGVQLGLVPASVAGVLAQERVGRIGLRTPDPAPVQDMTAPLPPPYLAGRFGDAELHVVTAEDGRRLETGALIQQDAEEKDPLRAIGVVVRIVDGTAIALVAGTMGQDASLMAQGRSIAIRIGAPWPQT